MRSFLPSNGCFASVPHVSRLHFPLPWRTHMGQMDRWVINFLSPASVVDGRNGADQLVTQQLVHSIKMHTDTVVAGVAMIVLHPVALAVRREGTEHECVSAQLDRESTVQIFLEFLQRRLAYTGLEVNFARSNRRSCRRLSGVALCATPSPATACQPTVSSSTTRVASSSTISSSSVSPSSYSSARSRRL